MTADIKTDQLQIRVSPDEKRELKRRARAAGMSVSSWVMARALPSTEERFRRLVDQLGQADESSFVLAEISDFLSSLTRDEFEAVLGVPPRTRLSMLHRTYVAAMVEHASVRKGARVPEWVLDAAPLPEPYFASEVKALRLHLLVSSPAAFRRRNLFVDASVGDRV